MSKISPSTRRGAILILSVIASRTDLQHLSIAEAFAATDESYKAYKCARDAHALIPSLDSHGDPIEYGDKCAEAAALLDDGFDPYKDADVFSALRTAALVEPEAVPEAIDDAPSEDPAYADLEAEASADIEDSEDALDHSDPFDADEIDEDASDPSIAELDFEAP